MSKTSVAQGQERGQGEFPGNGGASLSSFKGGVPEGVDNADQRKGSPAPSPAGRAEAEALGKGGVPPGERDADQRKGSAAPIGQAERSQAEALGLDIYETSGTEICLSTEEARLKRMKHGVITSGRVMEEQRQEMQRGGFRYEWVMTGFTYGAEAKWSARDISDFLAIKRKRAKKRKEVFLYTWAAEIQQHRVEYYPGQTALHYHLMELVKYGTIPPKPDKMGWWTHGSTSRVRARNPVGYLAKYVSKGGCLDYVPSGARLYGTGGLSKPRRAERSWWMCPAWVREKWGQDHRPRRASGGGWLSRLTGEIIPSAFRMVAHAQDWSWVKFERVEVVTCSG